MGRYKMNENDVTSKPIFLCGFGKIKYGKQYSLGNRVYDSRGIAMAHCSNSVGNVGGYTYLYLVYNKEE